MRRVVVGHGPDGRSRIASDDEIEPRSVEGLPRRQFDIWGGDEVPAIPTGGEVPAYRSVFPAAGGFRAMVVVIAPDSAPSISPADAQAAWAARFPGRFPPGVMHADPSIPGMHWTASVDIGLILDGEIELELDECTTTLRSGDWFVQNGTRHAWHSDRSCTIAYFFVGATAPGD